MKWKFRLIILRLRGCSYSKFFSFFRFVFLFTYVEFDNLKPKMLDILAQHFFLKSFFTQDNLILRFTMKTKWKRNTNNKNNKCLARGFVNKAIAGLPFSPFALKASLDFVACYFIFLFLTKF